MTDTPDRDDTTEKVILLVEDDAAVREFLQARIEMLGYKVIAAGAGQEALDLLRQRDDILLLFSDIIMPGGITGIDLAEIAGRDYPGVKVVLASGYAGTALFEDARLSPDVSVLSKPFRGRELKKKLEEVLGTS